VERQPAAGAAVNQLVELVAVARSRLEEREEEQLGRAFLQLAVERARVDICHRQIVVKQTSSVNHGNRVIE
jgi:stage V sporulation protein SpoVS